MTDSSRMRAALLERAGSPFRLASLPRPEPGAGEVLLRIAASGVNPLDVKISEAAAPHARQALPAVLGLDAAGTVEAVGAGVTGHRPGDAVYGMVGGVGGHQGTLAEFICADADLLAPKPAALSMREAAVLPLIFITAWEGLVDRAAVRPGQTVLIHGGAGGIGHVAIQLAKALGAEVFASGSARSRETIDRLGAGFIDYGAETVEDYVRRCTGGAGFDVVYDTAGGPTLDASFQAIRRFGHVVSALGWGTHALAPLSFRGGSYSGVFTLLPLLTGEGRRHHGEILREATKLAEAGKLRPLVDGRRFTLESVGDAYRAMKERAASGKLVVEIAA